MQTIKKQLVKFIHRDLNGFHKTISYFLRCNSEIEVLSPLEFYTLWTKYKFCIVTVGVYEKKMDYWRNYLWRRETIPAIFIVLKYIQRKYLLCLDYVTYLHTVSPSIALKFRLLDF